MITDGFTYVAFLMLVAGVILFLEKHAKWKLFNIIPTLVWIYFLNMGFCTLGLFDSNTCAAVYGSLRDDLLYAMIFAMLLRCNIRKMFNLGARAGAIFLGCSLTLGVGIVACYPLFASSLGSSETTWPAVAALYGSWVGGNTNMVAMMAPFPMDGGAFGCVLALDSICFIVWTALLLLVTGYAEKWNRFTKADTAQLKPLADRVNAVVTREKPKATASDWIFLLGLSLTISVLTQWVGAWAAAELAAAGLGMFTSGVCSTLFATVLGLICAMTPLRTLPAVEDLSSIYLYAVVSLMASTAPITALSAAPMWILFGFAILAVHAVLMLLLSRLFHWDLCMVSTASMANIGGAGIAPMIATAYDESYAGIGILMGILGVILGNFCALGMGAVLQILF